MSERTTDHPREVRTVYNRAGDPHTGWIMPILTWRGKERWQGQVERKFVTWSIVWRSRRYRRYEDAVARVNEVLDGIEAWKIRHAVTAQSGEGGGS